MKYNKSKFSGYLIQGKLKEAIAYLEQFPEKADKVAEYKEIFQEGILPKLCSNPVVNRILEEFQVYYHDIFWREIEEDIARKNLTEQFARMFELDYPKGLSGKNVEDFFDEKIEPVLESKVRAEGYHYLGGDTQGHLGPYIWDKTKQMTFNVQLPNQVAQYTVNLLSGFVSRSWLDYISLKEIGPGGWAGKDGIINCVIESYKGGVESEAFQVDFLKHEAQHVVDYTIYPGISGVDLEYRAKLVELIYSEKDIFESFLREASAENEHNTHAYASYRIVKNLSRKIWGIDYEEDLEKWEKVSERIKALALELYNEYPEGLDVS